MSQLNNGLKKTLSDLASKNVFIDKDVVIEDGVIIGANTSVLSYDQEFGRYLSTIIRRGASIGAGSTVYPGVIIGARSIVKPGSVVTRTVPPLAIVEGNPAIITGYRSTCLNTYTGDRKNEKTPVNSTVTGVVLEYCPLFSDLRGDLSVGEFEKNVPFSPKRYFLIFSVPTAETRGEHAHKECKQFLICVKGSCKVIADDGENREEFVLDSPNKGLYLPPMTWGIQYQYSSDAVLLVFASSSYDSSDYIRDYDEFLHYTSKIDRQGLK